MARRWAAFGTLAWMIVRVSATRADSPVPTVAASRDAAAAPTDSVARASNMPTRVIPMPEQIVRGDGVTFGDGGYLIQLPARETGRLPGGFADPTRTLQALPGVSNDSDFDGLLYVRGGDGGQNRILLDQVNVSDAYHFGGVVSVLNVDVIDRLEFMPGGYTAEYGDALAGVVQVRRRIGNPVEFQARSAVNALAGSAALEGPIGHGHDASWLVAGRRSLVDQFLRGRSEGPSVLPRYWDVDGRLWRKVGAHDFRLGLMGSGDFISARTSDTFEFAPAESSGLEWDRKLTLASLNWAADAGPWALKQLVAYGWKTQRLTLFGTVPQNARAKTRQFDWRADAMRSAFGWQWSGGAQVVHTHTDYDLNINRLTILEPDRRSNPRSPLDTVYVVSSYEARNVYVGSYAQGEVTTLDSALTLTMGVRFERSSRSSGGMSPTPRFRGLWRTPWRGWVVNLAAGAYRQYPGDRLEADPSLGNPELHGEQADHLSFGVARNFASGGRASIEAYARNLSDLIVSVPDAAEGEPQFANAGSGRARGLEFLVHLPRRKWDGWAAYTLGRVRYRDFPGEAEYAPAQDIRHTVSLVGRYRPNDTWSMGVRWRAQSGRPYTPVVGREDVSDLIDGTTWVPVLGGFNSGRFPWYERLDVRVERAFRISGARCAATAELVNALGRRNLYDYRYVDGYSRAQTVTMLPLLPTLGITATF